MLKSYIIVYDLLKPGANYNELYEAIRAYGTWGKITESCWIIVTTDSAPTIRDNLSRYLDLNDRIFVSRLSVPAAWKNPKADDSWVKKNLEAFGV